MSEITIEEFYKTCEIQIWRYRHPYLEVEGYPEWDKNGGGLKQPKLYCYYCEHYHTPGSCGGCPISIQSLHVVLDLNVSYREGRCVQGWHHISTWDTPGEQRDTAFLVIFETLRREAKRLNVPCPEFPEIGGESNV